MDAERQECLWAGNPFLWEENRTMEIIIQDDTFNRDMVQCGSLPKYFLSSFGSQDNMNGTKECRDRFTLMVDRRNIIGAVKAYIQEETGVAFKKQKLLSEHGTHLSDAQTLLSLGIKKGSTLILQYAPITQISMKMLMLCSIVKDPWSLSRSMSIIIHDDSYKDVTKGRSLSKSLVLKFGPKDSTNCRISYTIMVKPDDTIAAVKAYIQEQTGFSFKYQKLLNKGAVLSDPQTLVSLRIRKGSILILRYALVFKIPVVHETSCIYNIKIKRGNTVGDVKATYQEKVGLRFHNHILSYNGRILADDERLVDLDV